MPTTGSLTDEAGVYKTLVRDYYIVYEADDTRLKVLAV